MSLLEASHLKFQPLSLILATILGKEKPLNETRTLVAFFCCSLALDFSFAALWKKNEEYCDIEEICTKIYTEMKLCLPVQKTFLRVLMNVKSEILCEDLKQCRYIKSSWNYVWTTKLHFSVFFPEAAAS